MHQDHYLKIFNADSADIPTAISVFSSEVVFKDACTRNLPAYGFPFLRTVHHLLFLFNAVMFFCNDSILSKSFRDVNDIF